MATLTPKTTPEQQGAQYIAGAAPTFNTLTLIPTADSWSVKEGSELERSQDGEADVDNIGTAGHHLVGSGDFKIASGSEVPNKGDSIEDSEDTARYWIVTGDPEVTGWSSGGKALMVKLEIEYHKKVSDAIIAALP
tara:strand:+ start:430 stop:837 length:408 start_codon:yes stop_codon:yes gene_type:complete